MNHEIFLSPNHEIHKLIDYKNKYFSGARIRMKSVERNELESTPVNVLKSLAEWHNIDSYDSMS